MRLPEEGGAKIQDLEQVVVRHRLVMAFAIRVPDGRDLLKELLLFGWEHDVEVDFEVVEGEHSERAHGHVVTVLGQRVRAHDLGVVAGTIAACGGGGEEKKGETSDAPAASGPTVTVAPAELLRDKPFPILS